MNITTLNFFKAREESLSNQQGFTQGEVDNTLDYTSCISPIKDKLKQLYKSSANPKILEIINDLDSFLEKIKNS